MARTDQKQTVSLDLDALEREGDPGPFTFILGGVEYELVDPQSMDYRDLVEILVKANQKDVIGSLTLTFGEGQAEEFFENRIPAFKLNALLEGYLEHYGFELEELEEASGEAAASSPSSKGTAGRSKRTSRSRA